MSEMRDYRTADLSIPFKVLADLREGKNKMARFEGETSNALFETLEDWNTYLKAEKVSFERPKRQRKGPSL
jgi:hypothetical protein